MHARRSNPRAEYRLLQSQRANDSVSLAEKFPGLKSLTFNLAYFDANSLARNGELKYTVNVLHAKSFFCFACPNGECLGGDFNLSEMLEKAVAEHQKLVTGEMRCQGWHSKAKVERVPCHVLLRYKLMLDYDRS